MDVLITGASRGIGRAIAERLGRDGARVIVNWLQNEAAAKETAAAVERAGGQALLVQGDVRSVETLEKLVATAKDAFGGLDVLVHNAALGALKPMDKIRVSQWDLTVETSLRPFWLLTKLALPLLRDGARVIGITSLGSRQFTPGYAAMGASKAGVEALTRQLAVELAPRILVNSVCGGPVDTDSFEYLPDSDRWRGDLERATPLKRLGHPQDIAGAVALLCSPDAAWITGQTLVADGGLSCL
jgi:NAD(P)-dependent dehydrogenase (short-subunit alcohol dehydrogenase family)